MPVASHEDSPPPPGTRPPPEPGNTALPADPAPPEAPVRHASVLLEESSALLGLRPGDTAVDATLGAGGHAERMLRGVAPGGRVIGLDVDPEALALARERLSAPAAAAGVRLDLVQANFRDLARVLAALSPTPPAPRGILADLGVSSMQLDRPERGFSFRSDAPLDMRMDPTLPETAAGWLRAREELEIADALYHLGGERGSRRIARRIVEAREAGQPVETTGQLERLVRSALRIRGHRRVHPATRTFQALRMALNRELEALEAFLAAAPECLASGGVLAVLAFHSGEDRFVKQAFKACAQSGRFQRVTKSVLRPSLAERSVNRRARSAKLRALRRL